MALVAQHELAKELGETWRQVAFGDLAARLNPPSTFPCTFSQNAFRRGLLQFSFVEAVDKQGLHRAANDLRLYLEDCAGWDGRPVTAKPLVMIFSRNAAEFETIEQYQAFGWRVLQSLHDEDSSPWPEGVSTIPEEPFWSFCFAGVQLFVNMSSPAHAKRKSRNLGRHFTFVINPRERFDRVAGDTREGRKVRNNIRRRVRAYDGLEHSPLLGSFQKGEIEWVQYGLPEENTVFPNACPFRFRG